MTVRCATITTPDGPFTVVVDDDAVLASGWTDDVASLVALVHPTLRPTAEPAGIAHRRDPADPGVPVHDSTGDPDPRDTAAAVLADAVAAVESYYAGDLAAPGAVPVRQRSGEFRQHAWDVLRGVAPGEVVTYTQYAERSGRPAAVRAAAGACAMNAAALFVPCHRVLRTDGTPGGFRYGLAIKESLLARESALDSRAGRLF